MVRPVKVVMLRKGETVPIALRGGIVCFVASRENWEEACTELALDSHRNSGPVAAEICIRVDKQDVEALDCGHLARILQDARRHVWGAPVYLVVDPTTWLEHKKWYPQGVFWDWFETAHMRGVTDILEIPQSKRGDGIIYKDRPKDATDLDPQSLRAAINAATYRWEKLRRLADPGPWRVVMPARNDADLERFLQNVAPPADAKFPNLFVVSSHPEKWPSGSERDNKVIQELQKRSTQPRMLVTVENQPSPRVSKACAGLAIPSIHWGGRFQLAYALHRLHATCGRSTASSLAHVEAVAVRSPRKFENDSGECPFMLISSAFCPEQERNRCITEARCVDQLLHDAPSGVEYAVYPALELDGLRRLVESHRRILVWIHACHGDKRGKLKTLGDRAVDAGQWLGCFEDLFESLGLVVLAACHSASLVRCFAEAGAGVAIGFESETHELDCHLLVRDVVHAALQSGGDRDTILNAFRLAHSTPFSVSGAGFLAAHPVAYYSRD